MNFKKVPKKGTQQVASATEKYLSEKIAPELLSYQGRIVIIVAYLLLSIVGIYGWSQIKIDFHKEWLIGKDTYAYNFVYLNNQYFKFGFQATFYVDDPDIDYSLTEIQL